MSHVFHQRGTQASTDRGRPTGGDAVREPMVRAFVPPLTIALTLITATTLFLTAAAITIPPIVPTVAPAATRAPAALAATASTPSPGSSSNEIVQSVPLAMPDRLPMSSTVVDLARLIYAPGVAEPFDAPSITAPRRQLPGPVLLVVESGALAISVDGFGHLYLSRQAPQTVEGEFRLRAGDGVALPTATTIAMHNDGFVPAVALVASIVPAGATVIPLGPSRASEESLDWAPGATVQALGGAGIIDPSVRAATIALHRLSLTPDATLPLTARGTVVLAVETGTLELGSVAGLMWWQTSEGMNIWLEPPRSMTLLPTDAALLRTGASATLRNAGSGPALALVVSVEPAQLTESQIGTS